MLPEMSVNYSGANGLMSLSRADGAAVSLYSAMMLLPWTQYNTLLKVL